MPPFSRGRGQSLAGCGNTQRVQKRLSCSCLAKAMSHRGAAAARASATASSWHTQIRWCTESGAPHLGEQPSVIYPACSKRSLVHKPAQATVLTRKRPLESRRLRTAVPLDVRWSTQIPSPWKACHRMTVERTGMFESSIDRRFGGANAPLGASDGRECAL